jgi:hypothetical protein
VAGELRSAAVESRRLGPLLCGRRLPICANSPRYKPVPARNVIDVYVASLRTCTNDP